MFYLNVEDPISIYTEIVHDDIYVDKSMLIEKISSCVKKPSQKFICITRPRRFGKTYNANMLAAYYTKGYDTKELFNHLKISHSDNYLTHLNQYNVVYIDLSIMSNECHSYNDYIQMITHNMISDLKSQYTIDLTPNHPLSQYFRQTGDSFVFILDEWDSIFYKDFICEKDKIKYMEFLKDLLKDKSYVSLAYMTGILPIIKYSSGSALNNFTEYNFINDNIYTDFFGFTEKEVKDLCKKYTDIEFSDLEYWYDGYYTDNGTKLFNPRSVVNAFNNHKCKSYWTSTGPMSEIADCIEDDVDDVRDDIVQLVSSIPVEVELLEYLEKDSNLDVRDEILSSMVVFGFLTYHDGYLYIPNHELMLKFEKVLSRKDMGDYNEIVRKSKHILNATLDKDEELLATMIEEAHDKEIDLFHYNDENSLTCLLSICYIYARKYYKIEHEKASGKGRCDMIFIPYKSNMPAIVIELKFNDTPQSAIDQIINKNYILKVKNYNKILLIGMSYNSNSQHIDYKKHQCKIVQYK